MQKTIFTLLVPLLLTQPLFADVMDTDTMEARTLVKQYASQLKTRLMAGMKDGGPVNAIEVCKVAAPAITDKLSDPNGWQIARTSLRTRNPLNAPDAWETMVLQRFEVRKAAGESLSKMDYAETVMENGKPVKRYMKPIPTAELCLACHGSRIAKSVQDALHALYPEDQATGFKVGNIRGAFTLRREE